MEMIVSYHINTYNRVHLFENLVRSFEACNVRDGFEWIIFDLGSTDGTRDLLVDLHRRLGTVTIMMRDERDYFRMLADKGLGPLNARQRAHCLFGRYRNEARSMASGDMFIDIADDHQFIRRGDWVGDMSSIIDHAASFDMSSIVYRGLSLARISKANNERGPRQTTGRGVDYYVCLHKHYDDYHMVSREMSRRLGPYMEMDRLSSDDDIAEWTAGSQNVNHYENMLTRSAALGMKKAFMRFPYAIDFPNDSHTALNVPHDRLIVDLLPDGSLEDAFGDIDRPISTDEIVAFSKTY